MTIHGDALQLGTCVMIKDTDNLICGASETTANISIAGILKYLRCKASDTLLSILYVLVSLLDHLHLVPLCLYGRSCLMSLLKPIRISQPKEI